MPVTLYPFWADDPDLWDVCTLGGKDLPGLSKVTCNGIGRKLSNTSPKGTDGVRTRDSGLAFGEGSITVVLWTADQFATWLDLLDTLNPRARLSDRGPIEIQHPIVNMLGITKVYLGTVTGLSDGPEWGTKQATIPFVEFNPPKRLNGQSSTRTITPDMVFELDSDNKDAKVNVDFDGRRPSADTGNRDP